MDIKLAETKIVAYLQHHGAVESTAFIGPFNTVQVKICPVDEVTVLSQAKGMREVVYYDLPLKACRRHDNTHTSV